MQSPYASQSYNRYSYVLNNPLKYSDPSGFFIKKFLKSVFGPIGSKVVLTLHLAVAKVPILNTIAQVAACVYGGPWGCAGYAAMSTYAITGSFSSALKAGVITYVSGRAFQAIGAKTVLSVPERVLARGVVGGLTSVAQGGKFGQGFFSSAFTKFSTIQLDEHGFFHMEKKDFDTVMGRTAVAAMIGGTASEIGGGKFANGARTAAIAHLYNAEGFGRKKYNTYLAREEKFVRLIEEPLVINRVRVVDFIYMFRSFVLWLCGIDF